ncbi:MAG TPA: chase2 sensor protein [Methylophilaceae bacterium]|nr:chase2 sensor protein [Methylophilaceae bacterium]
MSLNFQSVIAKISALWCAKHGRVVGLILLLGYAAMMADTSLQPFKSFRLSLFDEYQKVLPRHTVSRSVVIVEIDESTLSALGQWPWPRNYLAALIDAISVLKPAAIGLDIIMPEPDHASPQAIADSRPDLSKQVLNELKSAATNDSLLADSLAHGPTVLGAAGFSFRTAETQGGLRTRMIVTKGQDPLPRLTAFPYVLTSLPELQNAARGQGLLSSNLDNGVVRRSVILASINNSLAPNLSLEMLRVAHAASNIVIQSSRFGVNSATIGKLHIPLQENGEAWLYFDKASRDRYISAVSVFKGEVSEKSIKGKLVLIGLTGLGLQDMISTPFGDRRPGVEAHAQIIEAVEDGRFLVRPWWMRFFEIAFLLSSGSFILWWLPQTKLINIELKNDRRRANLQAAQDASTDRRKNKHAVKHLKTSHIITTLVMASILLLALGLGLFYWLGLLLDSANILIGLTILLASLYMSAAIEESQQHKMAENSLLQQRIQAAKINGELEAASRIQLGTLPDAKTTFFDEHRFEIEAFLEPVRHVGGDLYDFFMMDESHLFFVIGDVSGKGMPASLLMVVTKALLKSAALRGNDRIDMIINMVNAEMSRENPEMLFVTGIAGILNVETGLLDIVNAGHDAPWLIHQNGAIERIEALGSPPLGVIDEFKFPAKTLQLAQGDTLFMVTDGVTEAMDVEQVFYTVENVTATLTTASINGGLPPIEIVDYLKRDLRAFVGEADASDDITMLALRWMGVEPENA